MSTEEQRIRSALDADLVILDTCFIMDDKFEIFLKRFRDCLMKRPAVILNSVRWELGKNRKSEDADRASSAAAGIQRVDEAKAENLVFDEEKQRRWKNHADQDILLMVQESRLHKNICVLTNDKALIADLYSVSSQRSAVSQYTTTVLGFAKNHFGVWDKDADESSRERFSYKIRLRGVGIEIPIFQPITGGKNQSRNPSSSPHWLMSVCYAMLMFLKIGFQVAVLPTALTYFCGFNAHVALYTAILGAVWAVFNLDWITKIVCGVALVLAIGLACYQSPEYFFLFPLAMFLFFVGYHHAKAENAWDCFKNWGVRWVW